MVNLHVPTWDALVGRIPEHVLYQPDSPKFGREYEAHCTVLFGFHDYPGLGEELLRKLPLNLPELTRLGAVVATGCDVFANAECDVVKLNLKSVELTRLNAWCKARYAYTSNYPDYLPHATLAYVQKGLGQAYRTPNNLQLPLRVKSLVYSGPGENRPKVSRAF
jgi:hypothetical protein